jgi:hypothetical protein
VEAIIMEKLTSRKFWICVAAFLGSVATSISGIQMGNETLTMVGTVCGVFSAAIYAAAEAYVDAKAVNSSLEVLEDTDNEQN